MPYSKNLSALKDVYPNIYEKIEEEEILTGNHIVDVEEARNGEIIIKIDNNGRWIYLNSKYNPTLEADKYMSDMYDMPEESILTIFGMSSGVFAREFLKNNKDADSCVIYEPSLDIFMRVIKNIDITDIIKDDRVKIVINGINEEHFTAYMEYMIKARNTLTNKHIVLPKYVDLFAEEFEDYNRVIRESNIKLFAIRNTVRLYGKRVAENCIHNLRYLENCSSSVDFIGKFPENIPAIVVAAGPSLEKNMHLLKKAKGKAIITVVDTAIPKVLEAGIIPDMVIAIDFIKPLKYFENPLLKDIPILCDADMNKDILDKVKPNKCIFFNADTMIWAKLFEEEGSEIRSVNTGGSVATALIANYIHWGIKKIILVGQDLAFTGEKGHIGEDKMLIDETNPIYTQVNAIGGGKVYTRWDFLAYIRWIENQAAICKDVEFIDATEGGALKEYTKVMSLQEAIDTYCISDVNVEEVINQLPVLFCGNGKEKIKTQLVTATKNIRNIKRRLDEVALDCHRAVRMIEQKDYNKKELKKIYNSMGKLDEIFLEMDERVILEKYISDAETEFEMDLYVTAGDDIDEMLRLYKKSEKYYRSIADAIPEILDIIQDCLDKMEKED